MINFINFIGQNYQVILSSIVGVLTGLIAFFMIIPGEQPEKALQGIVNFISKFSKK